MVDVDHVNKEKISISEFQKSLVIVTVGIVISELKRDFSGTI